MEGRTIQVRGGGTQGIGLQEQPRGGREKGCVLNAECPGGSCKYADVCNCTMIWSLSLFPRKNLTLIK